MLLYLVLAYISINSFSVFVTLKFKISVLLLSMIFYLLISKFGVRVSRLSLFCAVA